MTSSAKDFYMKEGEILSNKYNSFTKGSATILMSPTPPPPPPPPPTCRLLQGGESEINFPLSLLSLSTRTFACSRSRVGFFFRRKIPRIPLFPSLPLFVKIAIRFSGNCRRRILLQKPTLLPSPVCLGAFLSPRKEEKGTFKNKTKERKKSGAKFVGLCFHRHGICRPPAKGETMGGTEVFFYFLNPVGNKKSPPVRKNFSRRLFREFSSPLSLIKLTRKKLSSFFFFPGRPEQHGFKRPLLLLLARGNSALRTAAVP